MSLDPHVEWDGIWLQMAVGMSKNPGRKYRNQIILSEISKIPGTNLKLLDFGCGTGDLLNILQKKFPKIEYTGLDISSEALNKARNKLPTVKFIQLDKDSNSLKLKSKVTPQSVVIISEVLEHLSEPDEALELIRSLLTQEPLQDCTLLVTVPAGPMSYFDKFIGHKTHYSDKTITKLLNHNGFQVEKIYKAGFPGINFLRIATIVRGKSILNDVKVGDKQSLFVKIVLKVIELLFTISKKNSRFGWQIVVIARHQLR
jgi:SAM-dependent methyltransferase